jgi:hypothetical protein
MTEIERKALIETVRLEAGLNANYDGAAFKLLHRSGRCIEADGKHIDALEAENARLRGALGRIARLEGVGGPDAELQCADMASAALVQETQP